LVYAALGIIKKRRYFLDTSIFNYLENGHRIILFQLKTEHTE
jgi:hypothetical protein